MEKRVSRWRGAIAGGGERSQVEGSDGRAGIGVGTVSSGGTGGERSLVVGCCLRWRGAIAGGGERSLNQIHVAGT